MNDSNFTWGDSVRVRTDAPERFRPSRVGSVCGLRPGLVLVEFGDGVAIEVPSEFLQPLDRDERR